MAEIIVPQNIDAELSVLGSILQDGKKIEKVYDYLDPDDFYREDHQNIYKTMRLLYEKKRPIDILTVSDFLEEKRKLRTVGGSGYLASIVASPLGHYSITSYAQIIKEKASLRKLLIANSRIQNAISTGKFDDREELKEYLRQTMDEVEKSSLSQLKTDDLIHIGEKQQDALDILHNKDQVVGLSTGMPDLDATWRGMGAGDVIIIAGETAQGKSMLMQRVALNVALKNNAILYVSLEMTVAQQISRFYTMSSDDHQSPVSTISQLPIYFYGGQEQMDLKLLGILIKNAIEKHGAKAIFIDHLHYFSKQTENTADEIGLIIRTIKFYAVRFNVPIVVISVVRKPTGKRKMPGINELMGSAMLGFDADLVTMVCKDEEKPEITVSVLKNRPRSNTGKFVLDITDNFNLIEHTEQRKSDEPEGEPWYAND